MTCPIDASIRSQFARRSPMRRPPRCQGTSRSTRSYGLQSIGLKAQCAIWASRLKTRWSWRSRLTPEAAGRPVVLARAALRQNAADSGMPRRICQRLLPLRCGRSLNFCWQWSQGRLGRRARRRWFKAARGEFNDASACRWIRSLHTAPAQRARTDYRLVSARRPAEYAEVHMRCTRHADNPHRC
jgi:hypothetical protein